MFQKASGWRVSCLAGNQKPHPLTCNGSFLICVAADEVNILHELSPQLLTNSKTSLTTDDSRCPVLHVGRQSTFAVPLHQFLADGYLVITFYIFTVKPLCRLMAKSCEDISSLTWVIY